MPVMDEFKEERAALKQGTFKQKFQYFLDYYKWYVIGGIVIIACAGSLIHHFITYKENALMVALLNSAELKSSEDYAAEFMNYAGIDSSDYTIRFDPSLYITFDASIPNVVNDEVYYTSRERLNTLIATNELDIIISNDELFSHFANAGVFCDLRPYLSQEQLSAYEPYFYYVDNPLVEQISLAERNMDYTFQPEIPDPSKPELMEDPVPVGIYVQDNEALSENFLIHEEGSVALGVISNAPHPEIAAKYMEYLMKDISPAK